MRVDHRTAMSTRKQFSLEGGGIDYVHIGGEF